MVSLSVRGWLDASDSKTRPRPAPPPAGGKRNLPSLLLESQQLVARPPCPSDRRTASALGVPLQPLQVRAHFRGVLVAQVAVLLQSLVDDSFQLRAAVGIQPHRRTWAPSRMALKITPELSPRKGNVPVAISYNTAPNENRSCACIEFLRSHLLRRHVGDGAERRAGTGQVLSLIERLRRVGHRTLARRTAAVA